MSLFSDPLFILALLLFAGIVYWLLRRTGIFSRPSMNAERKPDASDEFRLVAPRERLSEVRFDIKKEVQDRIHTVGLYTCPHCQTEVSFEYSNFAAHNGRPAAKLPPDVAAQMAQVKDIPNLYEQSYLEFVCPGCRAPVRMLYSVTEFAMSSYNYEVIDIIESTRRPQGNL